MRMGVAWWASAAGMSVVVFVSSCRSGSSKADSFPGYDPPPLDELVKAAVAKGPPKEKAVPYVPPVKVTVPPVNRQDLSMLPKDSSGRPILTEMSGVRLVHDQAKRDPITGKGNCVGLAVHCVEPNSVPHGRSPDACWMWSPRCRTNQPWLEADCCPSRCLELYEALRRRDYSDLEASNLTMQSECFPSLREFLNRPR